ncbi:MAG: DEAD/DEAH box helicase [Clostridiales bacterium]|nr:DEAD/DEAH box helicase [Clostridiales bacterium]
MKRVLPDPEPGFLKALQGSRPLYRHQAEAILRVRQGKNVVIATGTGSGKTEAFLYPILLHLYESYRAGTLGPGVRALILYPMNALAYDQRDRLGAMAARLKEEGAGFSFTFGQYTGYTPEDEEDRQRHGRERARDRLPGELIFRKEMRENPPHILITNYSMLEYLLLRPKDSPLFSITSPDSWSFLVLDEVHTYRGARAIEMAMLLRRLQEYLKENGKEGTFRCLATSATLAQGPEDAPKAASFAQELFAEPFGQDDILLPSLRELKTQGSRLFTDDDYDRVQALLEGKELPDGPFHPQPAERAGALLLEDRRTAELRRWLREGPKEVKELAKRLFPEKELPEGLRALSRLVLLLTSAQDPEGKVPLLSPRYHFFLRSLEGALLSYHPEKRILLKSADEETGAYFEIALCRECGQHYLLAQKDFREGKVEVPIRDPASDDYGITYLRPLDEGEAPPSEEEVLELCVMCKEAWLPGKTGPHHGCSHKKTIRVVREPSPKDEERSDQMVRCSVCGYSGPDPVSEIIHGGDGPGVVIATTLHQKLPQDRKKILAFADGRQEAAYFAYYLDETYEDLRNRNLIYQVAKDHRHLVSQGLTLVEMAGRLEHWLKDRGFFKETAGELEPKDRAWTMLYREFLTHHRRLSLEGAGLVRWVIRWPKHQEIPSILGEPPWSLAEGEAIALMASLLDTLRPGEVDLRVPKGVRVDRDQLSPSAAARDVTTSAKPGKYAVSWAGEKTYRMRYLVKFLKEARGLSDGEAKKEARRLLETLWEHWDRMDQEVYSDEEKLFLQGKSGKKLNPWWYRLTVLAEEDLLYRCRVCGRLHPYPFPKVCSRGPCPGTLEAIPASTLGENHYRLLYQAEGFPPHLRVEEHTAQLSPQEARNYQKRFRDGHIHFLSSSTTFELGVDLGDLDVVFLRNMPPEAFNYQQRVGRTGRRPGKPGLAITYSRRSPHDLYHFQDPKNMVQGATRPPLFRLENEKIVGRHGVAFVMGHFFSRYPERFQNVKALLGGHMGKETLTEALWEFIQREKEELTRGLQSLVPPSLHQALGLTDGAWKERMLDPNSRLVEAVDEAVKDWLLLDRIREEAGREGEYKRADWASRRQRTMEEEDVLSFLSRKAVIPKYGFPVDVVALEPTYGHERTVELQRDLALAIAEYAPGSKVIANKKEWESYAVKRVPEREWEQKWYRHCPRHGVYQEWREGEKDPGLLPCGDSLVPKKYVVPRFGFLTGPEGPEEPKGKPLRIYTTRPYFVGHLADPDEQKLPSELQGLFRMNRVSPGRMVVISEGKRGQGFYICKECGASFTALPKTFEHDTPWKKRCRGEFTQPVSLAHEFVTDVLRLVFLPPVPPGEDPQWFSYSLTYALLEGAAEVLEVPSTDIHGTVTFSSEETDDGGPRAIVLYDAVPGGAGLVAQLENLKILRETLEMAWKRVSGGCGCAYDSSCYGCLRSYRNQFAHHRLKRGPVKDYLEGILGEWRGSLFRHEGAGGSHPGSPFIPPSGV